MRKRENPFEKSKKHRAKSKIYRKRRIDNFPYGLYFNGIRATKYLLYQKKILNMCK